MWREINRYYGINDLATGWEIKSLIEEKVGRQEFEKWIENTLKSPIITLEGFINNMNARVILQYQEVIPYLNSDDYKEVVEKFYSKILKISTIEEAEVKLIKYINFNIEKILSVEDKCIKAETLEFILQRRGFGGWQAVIDDYDSVSYLGFNHFDETQKILKKIDKELYYQFIRKILFPLKIYCGLEKQLEIIKLIKATYRELVIEYENEVMEYIQSSEFEKIDNFQKQIIIKKIIDSKCFSNKNEILLNEILSKVEGEISDYLSKEGKSITINSDDYMETIKHIDNFREKLFLLVYENEQSLFHLMMIEAKETSIIDIFSYNGITKNKYKNSTLRNINIIKTIMIVNTTFLINNYKKKFWNELSHLGEDVTNLAEITGFLDGDIKDVQFLIDNKKYFIAGTLLTQMIERLLRELYFKLEYGVVGVLKSSNFTLKNLLGQNKQNPLTKLFKIKELEALNFFLNDRENGENIRNNIMHYLIDNNKVQETNIILLLDILIFILLKVYYQGISFE